MWSFQKPKVSKETSNEEIQIGGEIKPKKTLMGVL